jgi:hypothetical protein
MDALDKRPKRKKINMRFGTWNVRSLYRAGSLRAVAEEILKYREVQKEYTYFKLIYLVNCKTYNYGTWDTYL